MRSKYEIHEVEGDTPYVTMSGDFSMDDLTVILDEMRDLYIQVTVIDCDHRYHSSPYCIKCGTHQQ
jgi:hypothetical protein